VLVAPASVLPQTVIDRIGRKTHFFGLGVLQSFHALSEWYSLTAAS